MSLTINTKEKNPPIALTAIVNEDQKNEQKASKQLLTLLTVLEESMEAVASKGTASSATEASDATSTANNGQTYEQAMVAMARMMSELQLIMAQFTKDKTDNDAEIAKAQLDSIQKAYKDLVDKISQSQADQKKNDNLAILEKVLTVVIAVVVCVVALAFGQVEIAAIVVATTVAQMTGLFDKAAQAISSLLQDMGVPKDAADIIAEVIVVVIVVAATALIAPQAAAEEVASASTEIAADEGASVATQAVSASAKATEESMSAFQRVSQFLNKVNPLTRLSARTNLCIDVGIQATTSTGLTQNLANQIVNGVAKLTPMSDEEKKKIQMILNEVLMIILMIVQAATVGGMTSESQLSKVGVLAKIKSFFQNNQEALNMLRDTQFVLNMSSNATNIASGSVAIDQGITEYSMADDKYIVALAQMIMSMINQGMDSTQQNEKDMQDAFAQESQSLSKVTAGEKAVSDLLLKG